MQACGWGGRWLVEVIFKKMWNDPKYRVAWRTAVVARAINDDKQFVLRMENQHILSYRNRLQPTYNLLQRTLLLFRRHSGPGSMSLAVTGAQFASRLRRHGGRHYFRLFRGIAAVLAQAGLRAELAAAVKPEFGRELLAAVLTFDVVRGHRRRQVLGLRTWNCV